MCKHPFPFVWSWIIKRFTSKILRWLELDWDISLFLHVQLPTLLSWVMTMVAQSSLKCSSGKNSNKKIKLPAFNDSTVSIFCIDCLCTVKLSFFICYTTSLALLFVLTGREYRRMATKRITMRRRRPTMKRHLNFRHTMNFIVLHGFVNQKKDVSGRLGFEE